MDVKCEQCGAEYEFDESLLGDKGTTVKCAACHHVFRVLPRSKDEPRASLKLRYVRTGRVETLGSLRDLQVRIRNGEASVDDQLGRDGFPFRRLGDVPELRNFFAARGGNASGSVRPSSLAPSSNHLPVSPPSMSPPNDPPRNPQGGRTVLGVGPQNPQPQNAQHPAQRAVAPAAQPRSNGGVPGRSPISEAPTAQRPRPDDPSVSQAPTLPGTPNMDLRSQANRSIPPAGARVPSGAPAAPSNPVRLRLDENERAPARATEDSSKVWVYAVVLLLLGVGGFFVISLLSGKKTPDASEAAARVEVPTPAPTVTPTPDAPIPPPGTPPATAQPAPGAAPSAPATAQAPQGQPSPEQVAVPEEPTTTAAAKAESGKSESSGSKHGSGNEKEPTDYGGWVLKGDRAFSRGELEVARTSYQNALALRGTGSEANTGLGFTLLAEGKAKEAIPHFDRAASSGYAEANIGLGDAYRRLGQKSEAAEAYKDYLQRLPGGSRASYAKAQLKALGAGEGGGEKAETPAGNTGYRPAGELEAPPPAPEAPSEPAPEGTP
jgi:predicted Zn finger-like uncharacterized protein